MTANDQPWTGAYEQQVNANMRAFQAGTMRPFDDIEEPPSDHNISCRHLKLLSLGLLVVAAVLAGIWLGLMLHNHALTSTHIDKVGGLNSTTTAAFLATHGTLDVDVTVVITQTPAPVPLAATATTVTVSHNSPNGAAITTEPSLAPGKKGRPRPCRTGTAASTPSPGLLAQTIHRLPAR